MKKWLVILSASALLAACTAESPEDETTAKPQKPTTEQTTTKETEETTKAPETEKETPKKEQDMTKEKDKDADANTQTLALKEYFLADGKKAHFQGEGIEFATYDVQTKWLNDNYVAHYVNNGGVEVQRIFRITPTTIELVVDEVIQTEKPDVPKIEWLEIGRAHV